MIASARPSSACDLLDPCDSQVFAEASAALGASQYAALRKLRCRVFAGVVEISGSVSSFYLKQLAQATILHLNPGTTVRNLVEVSGEPPLLIARECCGVNVRCGR